MADNTVYTKEELEFDIMYVTRNIRQQTQMMRAANPEHKHIYQTRIDESTIELNELKLEQLLVGE